MTAKLFGDLTDQLAVAPVPSTGLHRKDKSEAVAAALVVTMRADQQTIRLAEATVLAAGASTVPQTVTISATYGWTYAFTGTPRDLKLQYRDAVSGTWLDAQTVSASGSQIVPIFAGAGGVEVRLTNAGSAAITISSSLSS